MTDFDILYELLKQEVLIETIGYANGKRKITLYEPESPDHEEYSVDIHHIPKKAIAIKIDTFPSPSIFFNNINGVCKRADYVIIAEKNDKKNVIIFIELKRGSGGEKHELISQLRGAQCVIKYYQSIGEVFWGKKDFLTPKRYEYRFVAITKLGLNIPKKPSREVKKGIHTHPVHDHPKKVLKIISPHHLDFRDLAR